MPAPRDVASRAALLFRFYVLKSLALDSATARLHRWPRRERTAFLAAKVASIARLRGGATTIRVAGRDLEIRDAVDLGTLQTCLIDVHDELVVPGILDGIDHPVVVDVGANVGQFSTAIRTFYPAASSVAVEPDPDVHALLARNAEVLGRTRTICAAAGAASGTLPLHRHHLSAMSTLRPGAVETYDPANTIEVPVRTLDEMTADLQSVDLLKIDVEGFELEALRGAVELLGRSRFLLVEVGLGREDVTANLDVLGLVQTIVPGARIRRFGRPLGDPAEPICQDVLIDLSAGRA